MIDIDSIRRQALHDRSLERSDGKCVYSLEEVEALLEHIDELEARIDNALSIARIP
jgi:hypothetical protein